ncbi:MAG TPA: TldD/PmbA family protein [Thermoplasmata archaeon]|nr:TldD/PmbA family protein [Thermoplasmata archaeon]
MPDLRDHEGAIATALGRLGKHAAFADVLAERAVGAGLRLDTKSTTPSVEARLGGAIFRLWDGVRWVEAATSSLDEPGLSSAVAALEKAAAKSTGHAPAPGVSSTTQKESVTKTNHPMRDVPFEEILSLAKAARGWATSVPGVADAQVGIGWEDNERLYLNTAGARCFQRLSRVRAGVSALAVENGRAEFDFDSRGGVGGREILGFVTEECATTVARGAKEMLAAAEAPVGEMAVVLDGSVTGLFAHESFGHGTEADQFVRDRSYLKPILGEKVAPEFLTIADDGSFPGGWGTIYFDDEGHPGRKTVLVDHGKFVAALHDRETAAAFHTTATGNTRRADFLSRAFVRMTNTYVEPGDWSLEELVKEAKNGVLLERGTSGIEDPLGGQMQLKVKRGHRIENGEVTGLVSSMALSGKVLDFMRATRGVGKSHGLTIEPGYCGKGSTDLLPVGTGGVPLLSTAVVGPA